MLNKNILNITDYVISLNQKETVSPIEIFNNWSAKNNILITNWNEVVWFIDFIKVLLKTDKSILTEAQKIDKFQA